MSMTIENRGAQQNDEQQQRAGARIFSHPQGQRIARWIGFSSLHFPALGRVAAFVLAFITPTGPLF
jgi:hypothetical protein